MTPAELAALRARFPELAGMGAPDTADYLARRFPVGQTPEQFAPTIGAAFTTEQRAAIDAAKARKAGQTHTATAATGPWTRYAAQLTGQGKAIEVQAPDGTVMSFPAGTDEATMRDAFDKRTSITKTPAPNGQIGGSVAARQPMPVADLAAMATKAIDRVEASGGTLTPERAADMAQRIAAAKAGTLTVSPENAARAASADEAALRKMNAPDANLLNESGYTSEELRAFAKRAFERGNVPIGRELNRRADVLDAENRKKLDPGIIGGTVGSLADGMTFGFGDEFQGTLAAILGVQPDGQGGANWFDYSKPFGERYDIARDTIRQEQAGYAEAHPVASTVAEIGGSLAVPSKALGSFINRGASTGARVMRGGVVGGATAAAYGFGEGEGGVANRLDNAAVAAPAGVVGGGVLTAVGQGINSAIRAATKNPQIRAAIPTLEGLRATANDLYKQAEVMGGELPADSVSAMTSGISAKIREAGFDRQLHPRVAAVVDRLATETGPKSLQEMEILRRVASNAAASLQPDERRIAMQIIDAIDEAVDGMGGGSESLKAAREVWSRLRRMETIDEAIAKAGLNDDFAAGLRTQFKALLRNPRRLRGFSEAQKAAIHAVAMGGPVLNGIRQLGKLLSPTGISGAALTGGAAFSGAGLSSLAIPVAGSGLGAIANALTKSRATKALNMAGMSEATRQVVEALTKRPNLVAKAPAVPGLMGYYLTNQ